MLILSYNRMITVISSVFYQDFLVWMLEFSGLSYMSADHMGKEYRINSRSFDEVGVVKDLEVIDESIQPVQKGK